MGLARLLLALLRSILKRRRGLAEPLEELTLLTRRLVAMALLVRMRTLRLYTRVHVAVIARLLTARLTMTSLLHLLENLVIAIALLVVVKSVALLGVVKLALARKELLLATGRICGLHLEARI